MSESTLLAFCITELDPGGAERALTQIVTRLHARDWNCIVYSLSGSGELGPVLEAAGVPVVRLEADQRGRVAAVHMLRRELTKRRPALLQTFLFHANLAGRLAALGLRVPVVSGVRVAERDAPWRVRLDRMTQRLVTMNVCVSRGVAAFLESAGFPAHKLHVSPNAVDGKHCQEAQPADLAEYGIPPGARVLTFIGRLHPQKRPGLLLEAVAPLLRADPGLVLLMIGDGPLRETLVTEVAKLGLEEQVRMPGRVAETSGILKASAVLVLPSAWEGMPNVVLEAIAAGCPVVATRCEGIDDLVENGLPVQVVGVSAEAGELSQALVDVLQRHPHELLSNVEPVVSERFTWDAVVDEYELLYRQILNRPFQM